MVLPFPTFVNDLRASDRETRIERSTNTLARRAADGMETCGCPACSAFSCVSGEATPALLDIANAASGVASENENLTGPRRANIATDRNTIEELSLSEWLDLVADRS